MTISNDIPIIIKQIPSNTSQIVPKAVVIQKCNQTSKWYTHPIHSTTHSNNISACENFHIHVTLSWMMIREQHMRSFRYDINADTIDTFADKLYDDNSDNVQPLNTGNNQIGDTARFNIKYSQTGNTIDVILIINNNCNIQLPMSPQWNDGIRNRMHLLNILPPNCCKCITCGLCGTFDVADGTLPDCNGNGWTYEQSYIAQNCDRSLSQNSPEIYTPDECFTDCNPCPRALVAEECTLMLNLVDVAVDDRCIAADGNNENIDCTRVETDINEQCNVCAAHMDACDDRVLLKKDVLLLNGVIGVNVMHYVMEMNKKEHVVVQTIMECNVQKKKKHKRVMKKVDNK